MTGWWRRRALRFRIASVVALAGVLVLLAVAWAASGLIGSLLVDAADRQLRPALAAAEPQVRQGATALPASPDRQLRVLDTAGTPLDGRPPPQLGTAELDALKSGMPVLQAGRDPAHRWLGRVVTAPNGSQRVVVIGTPLPGYSSAQWIAFRWLAAAAVLVGLAMGVVTWLAVRTSLRPVRRMRAAARASGAGQRLPVPPARDELRELAEALNALLANRDEAIARLQRFTGDAAHELRSPVASIRAQAEVAVLHPDPELSAEVLADVEIEARRMSALVSDLLVLARSDAGELPPVEAVDLGLAVAAAIARLPPSAPAVRFDAPSGSCDVAASPGEVELVLDNLLRNAARYARAAITVTVFAIRGSVRLLVDDDGHGIPPEHRSRVFDRFYRVAGDRARDSGGSGLGLALVAVLVRRRRGSVRATESPEGGARFDIRWPSARPGT